MKVLFVTLCAIETNTSVTRSNIGLLVGLKDLDCDVTIIMPEIDSNLSYYDESFDLSAYKVIRIPTGGGIGSKAAGINQSNSSFKKGILNILRKVYKRVSVFDRTKEFLGKAKELAVNNEYYDIVLSTSDPKTSHLFVRELIENGLQYGKWIQHWGDPLSGDISSSLIYPQSYIRKKEKRIIERADKIVYVSPFTAEMQKKAYCDLAEKIGFVPLACDDKEQDSIPEDSNTYEAVYLGDYSSQVRNIMPLYNAFKSVPDIHLTIAGGTDLELKSTENVTVLPRVSYEKVKELESKASIIISVGNLHGTQIPGKLYYSAASQKNILVTLEKDSFSEMYDYLSSYKRFDICENTTEDIIQKLREIYERPVRTFIVPERLIPKNVIRAILS